MAEPTGFTPEQLEQLHDIVDNHPLGSLLFDIAEMFGWPTSDPDALLYETVYDTGSVVHQIDSALVTYFVNVGTKLDTIITNQVSHGDVLAAINAKVQAGLPVTIPASPSAAAVATAVWNEAIGIHVQANVTFTARQAMLYAGMQQYIQHLFGLIPLHDNPDFVLGNYINTRWLPAYSQWNVSSLNPRLRPAGETVLAYLQRVQPSAGWFSGGVLAMRNLTSPGGGIVASLICTLRDQAEDPPAAGGGAGDPVDLEPVLERLRLYMPLPGEGTAGSSVIIAGEGRAMLEPNTIAVLIDLPEVPLGWGRYGSGDPVYDSLGGYAFLSGGGFAEGGALRRAPNWLPVPPGADEIWWLLRPDLEGAITFVIGATG